MSTGRAIFETLIGVCGIVWGENGILGVQLPEADDDRSRARLLRRHPDTEEAVPPTEVAEVVADIQALLAGNKRDLAEARLDMAALPDFNRRVYYATRQIAPGATSTYGEIAARIGDRGAARAVGQALGRNPFPIIVPCHRVVATGSRLGGFSARGGRDTKAQLLSIEARHGEPAASLFGALPWAARPARSQSPLS